MSKMTFNNAMKILDSAYSSDKRSLNKLFRDAVKKEYDTKLSVKDASLYVDNYYKILDECYQIVIGQFNDKAKPDFDALVFYKYPEICQELKSKWIQRLYFSVFR